MKLHLVYFSPNGTTRKSVRTIAQSMGIEEIEEHSLLLPKDRQNVRTFGVEDIVLLGLPTAGMIFGNIDELFQSIQGNGTPLVGVVLYGGAYYGVSLLQMKRKAETRGFKVAGLGAFIGEYALDKNFSAHRPDEQDQAILRSFGEEMYQKIVVRKEYQMKDQPTIGWSGSYFYNMIVGVRIFMQNSEYKLPTFMKKKHVTDDCVLCMSCEKNCPTQAIDIKRRHFDLDKCIGCHRCINQCKSHAIVSDSKIIKWISQDFARTFTQRKEPQLFF